MARRDRDPRPPVEIIGGKADGLSTRVVVGSRTSRRTEVLVGLAAVALVGTGLVLRHDSSPSKNGTERVTTTTSSPTPSTTSPSPVTTPTGPVLPVQTGGAIVVAGQTQGRVVYLDLDTGSRTVIDLADVDVLSDQPPVVVQGGLVAVNRSGEALYVRLPSGQHTELGPATEVRSGGSPDQFWLLNGPPRGTPSELTTRAQLFGIDGRRRSPELVLPDAYVSGTTASDVILMAGGRIYAMGTPGLREVAVGDLLGTTATRVVVRACDGSVHCGVRLIDPESGASTDVVLSTPLGSTESLFVSDRDEVVRVVYSREGIRLSLGSVKEGPVGRAVVGADVGFQPVWLPGEQGLLYLDATGHVVRLFRQGAKTLTQPISELDLDRAQLVFVIPK
jgi:hypothetical protein